MSRRKICPRCGDAYGAAVDFCAKDGTRLVPGGQVGELIGTVIAERYRIETRIGEGGMGHVYLAEHVRMRRKRAIKIMSPSLVGEVDALQRFTREAQNASQLSHPNIAAILDCGATDDGVVYLAMAYVDGDSLAAKLHQDDTMHPAVAADILGQAADALQAAHDLNMLHRDVKPDNIMLDTRDARSDQYSLALVAFFALSGKPAFPAESSKESLVARLTKRPQTLQNAKQDVWWPDSLQEIFDKALARTDPAMPAGVSHPVATVDVNARREAMKREKKAAADSIDRLNSVRLKFAAATAVIARGVDAKARMARNDDIRVNIMPTPVFLWRAQQITTWKDANSKAAGGLYDTVLPIEGWSAWRLLVSTQRASYVVEVTPDKVPWPSFAPEKEVEIKKGDVRLVEMTRDGTPVVLELPSRVAAQSGGAHRGQLARTGRDGRNGLAGNVYSARRRLLAEDRNTGARRHTERFRDPYFVVRITDTSSVR